MQNTDPTILDILLSVLEWILAAGAIGVGMAAIYRRNRLLYNSVLLVVGGGAIVFIVFWLVSLVTIIKVIVFSLAIAAGASLSLFLVYQNSKRLFWCIVWVFVLHLVAVGVIYHFSGMFHEATREIRVKIARIQPPAKNIVKPQLPPIPKPKMTPIAVPKGRTDANPKVHQMPKGDNLKHKTSGHPTVGNKMLTRPTTGGPGDIATDPDATFFNPLNSNAPSVSDITSLEHGGGAGDPNGQGSGDIPAGFANGKIGGRVYFMRLKAGSGAWDAYDNGTRHLLAFLSRYFPCETEDRAVSPTEMRDKYLNKGSRPSFVYLYCDESVSFSNSEALILRNYIAKGGFMFLDSRPDPDGIIKGAVQQALQKVLPGSSLQPIPDNHPINSFLFRLKRGAFGENYTQDQQKNYGITLGGRLVVFYAPANFAHIYANYTPDSDKYFLMQYQMGANVMVYAICQGNSSGVTQRAGTNASITASTIQMIMAGGPATGSGPGNKPPEKPKFQHGPDPNGGGPADVSLGE